jgi:hypothetical protein
MNLSTCYTFCPQKTCHRLLLLGGILKFRCHVHHFVATLTLTNRLALSTSHMTPSHSFHFLRTYESAETF